MAESRWLSGATQPKFNQGIQFGAKGDLAIT